MERLRLFTIGFTKNPAETFFTLLKEAAVKRVLDIRLNNVSQLAGFAKRDDLRFFLKAVCGMDYLHLPELAPTQEILDAYKKSKKSWSLYERDFLELISRRQIEKSYREISIHYGCLLCGEEIPDLCHRRLVAEYLIEKWGDVEVTHLV
ncbi:MAG: DUF488 domain-containing protein [Candidatus Moduliflexus flocculans]|nr:DUF488 domain-containing protein [Candidatus Moduliflexus flocculans]